MVNTSRYLLKFTNQKLLDLSDRAVVADSRNYLKIKVLFPPNITADKTAVFKHGEISFSVPFINDECFVPHEVIKPPVFSVSVYAGDLITSTAAYIKVIPGGYANVPQYPHEGVVIKNMVVLSDAPSVKNLWGDTSQETVYKWD